MGFTIYPTSSEWNGAAGVTCTQYISPSHIQLLRHRLHYGFKTSSSTANKMHILSAVAAAILAPIGSLAAPAGDAASVPQFQPLYARENLCNLKSPPQLCTPNASVTVEETALRAYKFYRAFVVDGDPRTMFSLIDDVYQVSKPSVIPQIRIEDLIKRQKQHHPGYASGPQAIWSLFCNGRKIGTEQSTSWCFDASTNMSYAQYSTVDRWRWVGGCVHEHVSGILQDELGLLETNCCQWDQGEKIPKDKCYKLPANATG